MLSDHVTGKERLGKMKMKMMALLSALLAGVVVLSAASASTNVAVAADGSMNGAAGQMPAFYDGQLSPST